MTRAIVIVLGEQTDNTSHEWTQTTTGYIQSEAVVEEINSWVADVTAPSTPVYAKPNAQDAVRLNAQPGELMRVTGVSAGMQGDTHLWWSTTEGYVAVDALQQSQNPWSFQWTVPD